MTAGRDNTGVALWIGFAAGGLMAGAAYGDTRDLACLLDAGVILACGSAIALLSRWVSRGKVPGSVTPITDAPSALELACENERRIEELELRTDIADTKFTAVMEAVERRNQANGFPVPGKDDTQPIRRLRAVPRGEASLCGHPAVAPALALGCYDLLGIPL